MRKREKRGKKEGGRLRKREVEGRGSSNERESRDQRSPDKASNLFV